jgi:hypothetical protein
LHGDQTRNRDASAVKQELAGTRRELLSRMCRVPRISSHTVAEWRDGGTGTGGAPALQRRFYRVAVQ